MKHLHNYTSYDVYLFPLNKCNLEDMIEVFNKYKADFELLKNNHYMPISQNVDYFILHKGVGSYYDNRSYHIAKSEVEKYGDVIENIDLELNLIKYNI